ncbi:MAG TPA: amidohydrolase family protein [Candidatus Limnocylindria bacterium]|nr:amidohydrolase family protein [Candidatus Limnocylindria bacterium]
MALSFHSRTIDLHAHLTPRSLLHAKAAGLTLHGIEPAAIARGQGRAISAPDRLADMDRLGVDAQVVSAEPQMYVYEHDAAAAAAIHRECNDEIGELVAGRPDRFRGLAILPMQDIGRAIAELDRAMHVLGFSGAMIGDHVNGALYDEPRFRPFWRAAEEMGALVFVHQASPTLVSTRFDRYHVSNTIGNPVERTLSFAALVFGGVMDAFPRLEVALAHGGGYAAFAAGRMDWGWRWREEARANITRPPSEYLARFHYDCITHSERALRFLLDSVGTDRVVFGTDYPGFAAGRAGAGYQPREWLVALPSLTDAEKEAILGGNLERLLGAPRV